MPSTTPPSGKKPGDKKKPAKGAGDAKKRVKRKRGAVDVQLDISNPADRAFDLAFNHGVPVKKALEYCQDPISKSALHARIKRHKANLNEGEIEPEEEGEDASNVVASMLGCNHKEVSPVLPPASNAKTRARRSSRQRVGKTPPPPPRADRIDTTVVAKMAAIETLPRWNDQDAVRKTMMKRKKRSTSETNRAQFEANAVKDYRSAKFSKAVKDASLEYVEISKGPNAGKNGFGLTAIANKYNKNVLNSPSDRKLTKSSLGAYIQSGRAGKSPPKLGRPRTIPKELTAALATHATMLQVAGDGEANRQKMVTATKALTVGTEWEKKLKPDSVWRKVREDHPAIVNPVKAVMNEDRRVDWLTFKNINDWTDAAKEYLISIGMVKDEPGEIHGVPSEVSLFHPDDARFFCNTDETQHKFTTAGNKGGSTTTTYANASFPRSGERITESSRHTTGVYTVNLAGEPLPPLYITDSKALLEENFAIDCRICIGLPEVIGTYGLYQRTNHASWIACRRKGSMDTTLWGQFVEKVLAPCYPRMSKDIVRCPVTNKLLRGPVILKTDAGPGRLSKEAESWKFRKRMFDKGLVIMLGLPNGTAATQEMDQGYAALKRECKKSTDRVAGIKLAKRVAARKKYKAKKDATRKSGESSVESALTVADLDEFVQEVGDDPNDEDAYQVEYKGSVCNVSLGNLDLGNIVNGFPGDPIDLRPFDKVFTFSNIISWWKKVGFLPMSREATKDPKVRWERGKGGAPEDVSERIELLLKDYEEGARRLTEIGFNGEVLDAEPPQVDEVARPDGEDEQTKALVESKATNSASGMFKIGLLVANGRAMLKANDILVEMDKEAKAKKQQKNQEKVEKKKKAAIVAFHRWVDQGRKVDADGYPALSKDSSVAIVKVLLPRIAPEDKVKDYSSMKACNKWLGTLAGGTTWEEEMKAVEDEMKSAESPHEEAV